MYVLGLSSWIICRVFIFFLVCILPTMHQLIYFPPSADEFSIEVLYLCYAFMGFMMISLQILNIFWTYYLIGAVIEVKKKGKHGSNSYE